MSLAARIAGALIALLLSAGVALSHASLIASDPADATVLEASPPTISLTFSEPVRPLVARLTTADGKTRLLPPPDPAEMRLTYALPPDLAQGSHLVSWRVTSADGHPVAGALLFSVGAPSDAITVQSDAPMLTRAGVWALRAILIAALLFGIGGAVHAAFLTGRRAVFPRLAAGAGLCLLPALAGFHGLELLALPPSGLLGTAPWREAATGPPGLAFVLAGTGLALALLPGRVAAALALIMAGLAAATSGHAATAAPQLLMRPAVALHVIAAAFWIGALVPLLADLAQGGQGALRRFSVVIPWVLALLLASGVAIALVQLGHPAALWSTAYGRVLLVKLALVALLLLLAALNRHWLTPRAESGNPRPLRVAIGVEVVLALLVIGTIALWQFTPPPRSLPQGPPSTVMQLNEGALSARLEVSPPRVGTVTLRLSDLRLDGQPVNNMPVEIELSKPAYGLGPFRHQITAAAGSVDAGRFLLPLDGYWVLRLKVLASDFRVEELRDLIEIAPAR
ncbi:copper resistance CopC/CopD family protein [Paracoccus litorisediminis]|uniref:Copper resistance protein CopC n=1 Tax=Paracoccus litorisediminis TaxID=2006130 RepID=A0A844HQ81_9RHOB|nr:CopD family protein [Paracoccus litorisediminis]MTH61309.1 copper resistance protein CopC [Paracoccus litorisediminis]